MASIQPRHGWLLAALVFAAAGPGPALAASTSSQASTNVFFGSAPGQYDSEYLTNGPAAGPTYVRSQAEAADPGIGSASSILEAKAEMGVLRARGTVQLAAPYSSGMVGTSSGGEPDGLATFDDQITIGGGGGPHSFRLFYSLTGFAGQIGTAGLQFAAKLSVQAWGTGITILDAPPPTGISFFPPFIETYSVSASGTGPRAFGEGDSLLIQAADGAVLNLSGFLAGYLSLRNETDSHAPQTGTLDIWNTATFRIDPVTPGTTFSAASGHDYLAAPVPVPAALPLLLGALPVLAWAGRRRTRAG
jgi:hypothetical protein